jgi:hypothetical protein
MGPWLRKLIQAKIQYLKVSGMLGKSLEDVIDSSGNDGHTYNHNKLSISINKPEDPKTNILVRLTALSKEAKDNHNKVI